MSAPNQTVSGAKGSAADQNSAPGFPSISLPKGGGAIRGIGEKFAANPVTGTGSMSIPIATSPGRSGFGPQLSLSYDSGAGNGPFGFGWNLSVPLITRKTDKGLPRYHDADESDVFILSGAEDLVPAFKTDPINGEFVMDAKGNFVYDESPRDGYLVRRYRPRVEGLFARIERWTRLSNGDVYWRSISKDNITTLYGKTEESRIFNPYDSSQVFSWLICQSYDDKGNAIVYNYKGENSDGIDHAQVHEKNRTSSSRSANRYLKRIKYGNRTPNRDADWKPTDPAQLPDSTWMFEVVFDYEDGHYQEQQPDTNGNIFAQATIGIPPNSSWPVRQDCFSSYRAGFEVRTYRLCERVLMFHHFADELGAADYLVRSTEFIYSEGSIASFITQVTQSGYVRQLDGNYLKRSLPPLEFEYSQATVCEEVREVDAESLQNLPVGANGSQYQWLDLDGEGLQCVLSAQDEAWYYKRNLSPISTVKENGKETVVARFDPLIEVASEPSIAEGGSARYQFLDLAGDGNLDLVQFEKPISGFFERTEEEQWESFVPFQSAPNVRWDDPNLRFVDLTGDGYADILITEDDALTWYPSLAEDGFGPAERARQSWDEEQGPRLVFADGTQSIYLADISGDGLTDLVRIRNGEVCYWPNLGYGRFGAKVTMDNAPWFDTPDQFDQKRVRLADIDGSGTTDIIYLERNRVAMYGNECGNSWSAVEYLTSFPPIDDLSSVAAVDLLGNGTACLVWSSPLPGNGQTQMRYIALIEEKPHLLVGVKNNLGAETVIEYAASTKFYLQDKLAGNPWITRLPFPVHVVERVETIDRISRNRFVTRYAYHHGYYDGPEREFRGFGMVEQFDTEEFATLSASDELPDATNVDEGSHVPPVVTKTWFHTGAYLEEAAISLHMAQNYFGAPPLNDPDLDAKFAAFKSQYLLDDTVLPDGLTAVEQQEACRALKGAVLRQEIYAADGTSKQSLPYSVSERNYTIECLQPIEAGNRHGVFFTHARETIDYHYERNLSDPRVGHALTLEVDAFGNVLKSLAIGYGRLHADPSLAPEDQFKQTRTLVTYTENTFTNPVLDDDNYRTPLPAEARTYELTGYNQSSGTGRYVSSDFVSFSKEGLVLNFDEEIAYEQISSTGKQRRLIDNVRTLYRRDDLTGLLSLSQLQSLALAGESYKLAFTPGLLDQVFVQSGKATAAEIATILHDEGGYVQLDADADWWIPSGRSYFLRDANAEAIPIQELAAARAHFFLPCCFKDPFGNPALIDYDAYDLLLAATEDALQNTVTAITDYRVLQPKLMTDPNGNRAEIAFDALGMVAGTAVMGKETESLGDSLAGFEADLTAQQVQDFVDANDPHALGGSLLGSATTRIIYDLDRFKVTGQSAYAATLARETHVSDPVPSGGLKIQVSFSYSDGFGRENQEKIQAEPGLVEVEDDAANITTVDTTPNVRWVSSGWTILNNKGKPVRQYEPFFSTHHQFQFGSEIGVSPVLFYDPVERVIATLHPNHTYEKVIFDPWRQESWDVNDTVLLDPKTDPDVRSLFLRLPDGDYLPTWHTQRIDGAHGPQEQDAAQKAAGHAGTPTVVHFDALGRPFVSIAHNRTNGLDENYPTRTELDIEGNQRAVFDALGRKVMIYDYDMLSTKIHQVSIDAGERWTLSDVAGKPIRSWDSGDHQMWHEYDALRRPISLFVQSGAGPKTLAGRLVYGEGQHGDQALNLRGKVFQQFDGAGIVTNSALNPETGQLESCDFKGNLLRSTRQLRQNYWDEADWSIASPLEDEIFASSATYDALNRPVTLTTPDRSAIRPTYNEANLLEQLSVNPCGAPTPTPFVTNIDYNAKGQRVLIEYSNHARTSYDYDPETFRLIRLRTTRPQGLHGLATSLFKDPTIVQDRNYAYDPAGNITSIRDDALLVVFHKNEQIDPNAAYTYDAIYRLIAASGREHIGQTAFAPPPPVGNLRDYPFVGLAADPNDVHALRNYTEQYQYDAVGNFEAMIHIASNGNWTRDYHYAEPSLIESGKVNNRLSSTTVRAVTDKYAYDVHGNMIQMPHLPTMEWDSQDHLHVTQQQVVNGGSGERTYYVYDATGQRVRKVTERANGTRKQERTYLGGGYEIYREYNGDGSTVSLERERLHIMGDKRRVALVETKTIDADAPVNSLPSTSTRYQFDNHLGSVSLELDENAAVISYEEYYPYGSTSYQAGRSAPEVSLKQYRYTGKERDEETGLNYHGARYYASWLGRWTASDPSGTVDGPNTYAYVRGNPAGSTDPTGRETTTYLGSSNEDKYVARLDRTWGGNQYWSETGSHGAGWYVRTEGDHVLAAPLRRLQLYLPQPADIPYSIEWTRHDAFVPHEPPAPPPRTSDFDRMWCGGPCRPGQAEEGKRWAKSLDAIPQLGAITVGLWGAVVTPFLAPEILPGIGGKALAGGIGGGITNVSTQIYRDPSRKELNLTSLGTSVAFGAAGTAFGSYLYGAGGPFAWAKDQSLFLNAGKFGASQGIWFIYGQGTSTVNSWVNGTPQKEEGNLANFNQAGQAARSLLFNVAGAYYPAWQVGGGLQQVTDRVIFSPVQAAAGTVLFPNAGVH